MKEYRDKVYFDDSISLPNESGRGIQLGLHSAGPRTGTNISGFGWRDITVQVIARGVGATDPTWAQIDSTDFWAYKFAVNDKVWAAAHIPHDYLPSSPIHFHAHWLIDASASPYSTNAVTWEWTYAFAKGFDQEAFDFGLANSPQTTAKVVTASEAAGVPYQHMVTETSAVTIPGLTEPDGIIYFQLRRVNNTSSPIANQSAGVFLMTSDIHYRSTNLSTAGKAPDFYAAS
jgi:hypothetical protein